MTDQDDGTLLRAKVIPGGIPAYLVGKMIVLSIVGCINAFLTLSAAHLAIGGVFPSEVLSWVQFVPVVVLSVVSTIPVGIILGGLARSPMMSLPVCIAGFVLIWVSGIIFPLGSMPETVQGIAKVFPVYWLGELSRHVFAPGTFGVLNAAEVLAAALVPIMWFVVGSALCPFIVGVLSRRQSGRRLASIQSRRLSRGY